MCMDRYIRKSDVLCKVDTYVYMYIYIAIQSPITSKWTIYREASYWTFSAFKGEYYSFFTFLLYFSTKVRYIRELDTVRFILYSEVRCDFGLFTIWFDLQLSATYEVHMQIEISMMIDSSLSFRVLFVRHDNNDDNDDNDDTLMLKLSSKRIHSTIR